MQKIPVRYRHGWLGFLLSLITVLLIFAGQAGWLKTTGQSLDSNQPGSYRVTHFVDGDTIAVDMNGHDEKIRFIGVDTPETHKPNTPVQCYGPAAAAFTKNSIGNQRVRLVADELSSNRDRYNRLLRYVYLADGRLLNEMLISGGYGFYYPYFPFTKSQEFNSAELTAQTHKAGLWGNCQPTPTDGGGWVSNNAG
jgi:micrococcal nuclease